jgi:hypothetical protein
VNWLRAALKQPLSYFMLLGAAVFIVDLGLRSRADEVLVSAAVRDEVAAELERALKRPPSDEELTRGVEEWTDTELLFREAEALGLAQNDAVIRAHLASKLQHIVRKRSIVAEPSEAELSARFDAERVRYTAPDAFDAVHVFVLKLPTATDHEERVEEILARLRAGVEIRSVGDHFPRGPTFSRLTRLQLEQAMGVNLSASLGPEQVGVWQLLTGQRGTHLFRLDAVHSGQPTLESARKALIADIQEEKKQQALREFTKELRKKYGIASGTSE